ncbi:unnamed protein product [Taenia asiatica]|uniref:Tetraspanin n=1 Tax=Taenia asiatica TaxID=60517 RepID=A0A158R6L9_TAEAS|nr:unnamed protein product [Taenia asiatica]
MFDIKIQKTYIGTELDTIRIPSLPVDSSSQVTKPELVHAGQSRVPFESVTRQAQAHIKMMKDGAVHLSRDDLTSGSARRLIISAEIKLTVLELQVLIIELLTNYIHMGPLLHPHWSCRDQSCKKENTIGPSMGKALTRVFRLIFQVITAFLLLGFLLTAVGGIILKSSTSILQSSMKVTFKGYEGDADNLRQFADFLLEIADTMAIYCIVFGMVLAVLALIGLIASYCGWYKVLKIYAVILIVLLVVQIIIVAVIFSSPTKYANGIVSAVEALLTSYGNKSEEGNASTTIWNVLMEVRIYDHMGRVIARSFRAGFQAVTIFLFLTFLTAAVGGIVMKTSTSMLQSTLNTVLNWLKLDARTLRQFTAFLFEIADTMALYSIVVGVVLAVFALIGLITSCCGCSRMLKIHTVFLVVLLVVQVITVIVLFSDPIILTNGVISSTEARLKSYGDRSEEGNKSTTIWNLLMRSPPWCCGMNGYEDFGMIREIWHFHL